MAQGHRSHPSLHSLSVAGPASLQTLGPAPNNVSPALPGEVGPSLGLAQRPGPESMEDLDSHLLENLLGLQRAMTTRCHW